MDQPLESLFLFIWTKSAGNLHEFLVTKKVKPKNKNILTDSPEGKRKSNLTKFRHELVILKS